MKDFDFDELDRAVSSALSGASTAAEPVKKDDTVAPTGETIVNLDGASTSAALVQPMTPVPKESPAASSSDTASSASGTPLPKPSAPPANRRSAGRFMDFVPQGAMVARPVAPSPATERPIPKPVVDEGPAETIAALESPFLPGAKVEKRPLGGPAPLEAPVEIEEKHEEPDAHSNLFPDPIDFSLGQTTSDETPEETTEVEEVKAPEPKGDTTTEAPVEVKEDEVSELATSVDEDTTSEDEPAQETPAINAPTTMSDFAAQKVDAELIDIDAAIEPETYGPTSITQQYQEQPSSTSESGAIYDTESYHQPIVAPAKKKNAGLRTTLTVLGLVVLGAGLGVVFYFYVLPML